MIVHGGIVLVSRFGDKADNDLQLAERLTTRRATYSVSLQIACQVRFASVKNFSDTQLICFTLLVKKSRRAPYLMGLYYLDLFCRYLANHFQLSLRARTISF